MAENPVPQTAQAAPQTSDKEVSALITRHRAEIDRVLALMTPEQRRAVDEYGPPGADALTRHYASLQKISSRLAEEGRRADAIGTWTGWGAFAAVGGLLATLGRRIAPNPLVHWSITVFSAIAAGLAGKFIATGIFAGRVREESGELNRAAREALERELAVAIENRRREGVAPPEPAAVPDQAQSRFTETRKARDASFVAQEAAQKKTATATETALA